MFARKIKTSRGKLDLTGAAQIWGRFRKYSRAQAWGLVGALAAAFGVILTQVVSPWPIKIIFDYVLPSTNKMSGSWISSTLDYLAGNKIAALGWVCGAVLLIAATNAMFAYFRDVQLARAGQKVVGKIRADLFEHLQSLAPADLGNHHTGTLLMRLTGDIQMLRQMLVNAVINAGENVLLIVCMIGVMFMLNPLLALLGICTIPIGIWAGFRISKQIRKAAVKQRERESELASIAQDVLGAMSIVQAFNREPIEQKRFARQNRGSIRAGVKATKLESKLNRIVSMGSAVSLCVILYVGVRSVISGAMTAGDLLVFVSYLRAVHKPLRKLAKLAGQVAKATACGERIAEIFSIVPSVQNCDGAVELQEVRGEISFDNVTFCYEEGLPALDDVSLTVKAGEHVALVGQTGAGKSTFVKLLLRFYDPTEGIVKIDGDDVKNVTLSSLRDQVGWVHQDTVLFGMTVAENIALGRVDAAPEAIRAASRSVQAEAFIDALPEGFDTVLGQDGDTLSGGQRQRIALARALLRSPSILLLDEPATGLDEVTRRSTERAWMDSENKATTVVICHRLEEMRRFDRIMVLSHGRIVETGTHDELLSARGDYAALFAAGGEITPDPTHQQVTNQ